MEPVGWAGPTPHPGHLDKTGLAQQPGDLLDRPAIGGRDLVVKGLSHSQRSISALETKQQVSAWNQRPLELGDTAGTSSGGVWMME